MHIKSLKKTHKLNSLIRIYKHLYKPKIIKNYHYAAF